MSTAVKKSKVDVFFSRVKFWAKRAIIILGALEIVPGYFEISKLFKMNTDVTVHYDLEFWLLVGILVTSVIWLSSNHLSAKTQVVPVPLYPFYNQVKNTIFGLMLLTALGIVLALLPFPFKYWIWFVPLIHILSAMWWFFSTIEFANLRSAK